jgi:hypothetical protein
MAQEDNYKEGVDFEMVLMKNQPKGGTNKTRHFFTKAEKAARAAAASAPKTAPKAKKKLKGLGTPGVITVTSLNPDTPPGSKPSGMPMDSTKKAIKNYTDQLNSGKLSDSEARTARTTISRLGGTYKTDALRDQAASQTDTSRYNQGMKELMTGRKGAAAQYKKGGMIKEGSAKDMSEDKMKAKKAGMSMSKWEKSSADKKHDAPKKMATGGVVKKATGGSMRGTGCAVRGKGYSGSY